ncbi:nuclear transport factor 2 family protein [Candidatus Poribacteria bacterium]|nr:nuclear transport factor 2 family protein [Candidatus Poribacteria bacterium]
MNDVQNRQNSPKKTIISRNLIWGGAIAAIVIAFVLFLVIFMSSSETPTAFLAKWKSALESTDAKKYESLWVKSERQHPDRGYQNTARLLRDNINFEVNLEGSGQPYRVPRFPNRYRIEGIPVTVHLPDGPTQQLRNLVIEKKGIIQQRWKIIQDEVAGEGIVATVAPESTPQPNLINNANSPVAPTVIAWKSALEAQDVQKYTDLWDKSARKKRAASFRRATELMSQTHIVEIQYATYSSVPTQKNRYVVDGIRVTLQNGEEIIETHNRTLTIEKKGFFRRQWKLINDQIGEISGAIALARAEQVEVNTVSGEESGGTFDGNAPIDTHLKVRQILGKWQEAWEGKDLETYMSVYSDSALITRVTIRGGVETEVYLKKNELRAKMRRLNNLYGDIQVGISNLQINGDRAVADVTFLQKFTGTPASGTRPAYSDIGTKKLNLMVDPTDGHWRIYAETWKRYENVPDYPKM